MNMKVQILSRKLIAPSSPTPPNLQNLKISCFDQLAPPTYVPCIFYYPVSGEDHGGDNADRSKKVEISALVFREFGEPGTWIIRTKVENLSSLKGQYHCIGIHIPFPAKDIDSGIADQANKHMYKSKSVL